jgi:hypothetical protein
MPREGFEFTIPVAVRSEGQCIVTEIKRVETMASYDGS